MPAQQPRHLPPPPDDLVSGASLFLDFDGTLVEIADRPDAVMVSPDLRALVHGLAARMGGRLAIVSGRAADDILAYLGEGGAPGFAVAGSHGLELVLPDGTRERPDAPDTLEELIDQLETFASATPGVAIERKPYGAALHFRQAPDVADAVASFAAAVADGGVFTLQHGKMVCELRLAGADKGDAVAALLAMPPMAGTRPVFVGDDLTDEAGFRAALALGGIAVLVGDQAETAATCALPDVAAVHRWLARIDDRMAA